MALESAEPPTLSSTLSKQSLSRPVSLLLVLVSSRLSQSRKHPALTFFFPFTATKQGAIVAGQTSVKAPERDAFETYLPEDVNIISLHSLHGPSVPPEGQPLVSPLEHALGPSFTAVVLSMQIIIQHRAPDDLVRQVETIMAPLKSRMVHMSYNEHDEVTANTQAVTHAAFLSMGTAWHYSGSYPWETSRYIGGIETAKVNIALRIYAAKWHVYAGLAILNPAARVQIDQYARSVTDLFKLMIEERTDELKARILKAKEYVFGQTNTQPVFISDDVFNAFTVGRPPPPESEHHHHNNNNNGSGQEDQSHVPANSHLSLLAMVDCWATLGILPFKHLELAATPIFRLWFGVVEYLFRDPERLERAIQAAVKDKTHRSDDAEFTFAARAWSQCVRYGSFEWYKHRFTETANFFRPRFEDASKVGLSASSWEHRQLNPASSQVSAKMIKEVLARDQTPRSA